MSILFLSRAKHQGNPSPVIQAQFDSLKSELEISFFLIRGSGWKAYFKGIFELRKYLRANPAKIIHAHYSYVGIVASLASQKPIIVSLMGSDIEDYWIGRMLIRVFAKLSWNAIIVKSQRSKDHIALNDALVIPNGVNFNIFKPIDFEQARNKLSWVKDKKYILFLADPLRKEKNYTLAKTACSILNKDHNIELKIVFDVPLEEIPIYLSAVDVLLLTSLFEGSPNAIKEAMACNCPIVSTDVGDVREVIANTEGCYISTYDPEDVATKLRMALEFGKRTIGREHLGNLDSTLIAQRLMEVYESVLIEK
jgi:teichuronic acid biosynthesis glycosyltransferase TuaC